MSKHFEIAPLLGCLLVVLAGVQAVPEGRIMNGVDAMKGQFPHQISLRKNGFHLCGGSIISRNYVLTAAHCVGIFNKNGTFSVFNPEIFTVYAGSVNRFKNGVKIPVAALIPHKKYGNFCNDIALVKLAKPLKFSKLIQRIDLMPPASNRQALLVTGWGRTSTNGPKPANMQWTIIWSMSTAACKKVVGDDAEKLICLKPLKNHGTCTFDSGGPAIDEVGRLVGLDGYRLGTCEDNKPRIYTNVYYHIHWIKEHSDLTVE